MSETSTASPLATALAAFQKEIPSVAKGSTAEVETRNGRNYRYQYAPLEVITPLALPLLGKHGLAWSTQPTMMGEQFVLHYSLTHESGEAIEGLYPLPDPLAIKPQELGSAITYARRYALCAVTGIAPGGDDDDAQQANGSPAASKSRRTTKTKERTEDWAGLADKAKSVDQLRAVHSAASQAGELGLPSGRDDLTVDAYLRKLKTSMEQPAEPVADESTGEVLDVPATAEADDAEPVTEWATAKPGESAE